MNFHFHFFLFVAEFFPNEGALFYGQDKAKEFFFFKRI